MNMTEEQTEEQTNELEEAVSSDGTAALPAVNTGTAPEARPETGSVPVALRFSPPYAVTGSCLGIVHEGRDGEIFTPLCTFVPYIQAELTYDDGAEVTKQYRIGGIGSRGCVLPPIDVPATDLEKMDWMVNHWDASCDLCAVPHVREHIRAAVKQTGEFAEHKTIYAHTGWIRDNGSGEWQYLLPGCDGPNEVRLQGKQKNYESGQYLKENDMIILRSLLDSYLAPKEILYPCLATVFLSPLNEFLKQVGFEPKFILTLVGRSGSKKSTLAALMMSFFGRFTLTDLPMSFHDTANSIIYNAFTLKDVLTVVDDYHPTARRDAETMRSIMQTLARGYGDRAGRNRLTPGVTLREARPPQGNVIVTAEFPPDIGESGTARLFNVEMSPESVNLKTLSDYQAHAEDGVFMRCLYGYIYWLKETQLDTERDEEYFLFLLKKLYQVSREQWREKIKENSIVCHDRLPDTLACLCVGFTFMTLCMKYFGVFDMDISEAYDNTFKEVLLTLAAKQSADVEQDKPTHIFIRKLTALMESGQVRLMPAGDGGDLPAGCIGYEDAEKYYLFLEVTHRVVKKLCEDQEETFSVSSKALAKAMVEEGHAEPAPDGNTHTQQIRFGEKRKRVLVVSKAAIAAVDEN